MSDMLRLEKSRLRALSHRILHRYGFSDDHAWAITDNLLQAQEHECFSHGLHRLSDCINVLHRGGLDPVAEPVLDDRFPAVVHCDANNGCAPLAIERGCARLVESVRSTGIACLAINNCFHFSALWIEVERIAREGCVALAMTPTLPFTAPTGGRSRLLGTNPFAFSWPRPHAQPYTFDFATSEAARGRVELCALEGRSLPAGWAIDVDGEPTTDPQAALEGALLAFGGHKGSAIATMIELLAGPLISDKIGREIAPAVADGPRYQPVHGELIIAFEPHLLGGSDMEANFARAEDFFREMQTQGARLPSQNRQAAGARSARSGIPISEPVLTRLHELDAAS